MKEGGGEIYLFGGKEREGKDWPREKVFDYTLKIRGGGS